MPMIGNIDYGIDSNNGKEPGTDRALLPLNLLAMIISYVCLRVISTALPSLHALG